MNNNALTTESAILTTYWPKLKTLSDNMKLELIILLSRSMTHSEDMEEGLEDEDHWTDSFAGKWQDERTTEEIIDDIHAARNAHMKEIIL